MATKDRFVCRKNPFNITEDTDREILEWHQTYEIGILDYENLIKFSKNLQKLLSQYESVTKEIEQPFKSVCNQRKLQLNSIFLNYGISKSRP